MYILNSYFIFPLRLRLFMFFIFNQNKILLTYINYYLFKIFNPPTFSPLIIK